MDEAELGGMKEKIETIEKLAEKILSTLHGENGLVVKTEINAKDIETNKKEIAWVKRTFITTIFVLFIGLSIRGAWVYVTGKEIKNEKIPSSIKASGLAMYNVPKWDLGTMLHSSRL